MESLLALGAGLTILVIVLTSGVHHGAWFIAAVAAYTLIRQAILRLREERRQSRLGSPLVALIATLVLGADLALLATT